jgi:Flp pilus assembly protein TadD
MSKRQSKKRKKKKGIHSTPSFTPPETSVLQQALDFHRKGQLLQAESLYKRLIGQAPNSHEILNLLGVLYVQQRDFEKALLFLTNATALSPHTAKYHYDLGVVLQELWNLNEAVNHYRVASKLQPDYHEAWENLAVALSDLGRHKEASEACAKSLLLQPDSLISLCNLATIRRWQGKHEQSLQLLKEALQHNPAHIRARDRFAQLLLSLGEFESGWIEYSWRVYTHNYFCMDKNFVPLPKWAGGSLAEKRIIVHSEQGIGDEVMFASCLEDLLALKPAHTAVMCDPRLTNLFKRSFPSVDICACGQMEWGNTGENIEMDIRVPLGDLPRYFRSSLHDFRDGGPYLVPDPDQVIDWSRRLQEMGGELKVGISWRGSLDRRVAEARSIPLHLWKPILETEGCTFINLQYGDWQQEIDNLPETIQKKVVCFEEINPLLDLESFAALIKCLDLIITVDNSTVHFAGAIGTPTWLLLPALADFRWHLSVPDGKTPWYSSVTLLRQDYNHYGQWQSLLDKTASRLKGVKTTSEKIQIPPSRKNTTARPVRLYREHKSKILLLNDTSFWYHWGCTCTSLALRQSLQHKGASVKGIPINSINQITSLPHDISQLTNESFFLQFRNERPDLAEALQNADKVVINGEGSLHGSSPLAAALLYLAWLAKNRFGKQVHLINHSCYPDNSPVTTGSQRELFYHKIYEKLDTIAVRESVSYRLLENLGLQPVLSFDCLPLFINSHQDLISRNTKNRILIAGSVSWTDQMLQAMCNAVLSVSKRKLRWRLYLGQMHSLPEMILYL